MFDFACEDTPPPVPPSPDSQGIAIGASIIEWGLWDVMRHDHPAYHLGRAMHSLHLRAMANKEERLPAQWTDQLLSALALTHSAFLTLFPDHKDQQMALKAFDAAVRMIEYWSQSDADRACLEQRERHEMELCIRWLRNACHNIDIVQQIDECTVKQWAN